MKEELGSLIGRIIEEASAGKLDSRVIEYTDYKTKYVVLKPRVTAEVELTNGKIMKIDITDYFEGGIK